jgi:hypothetical protein
MATFKRPTIRPPYSARIQNVFATHWLNGAQVSQWVPDQSLVIVPSGTPGRAGEIMDIMNRGVSSANFVKSVWSPPYDYEFYARRMIPESERESYINRCKDWGTQKTYKKYEIEMPKYAYEETAKFWQQKISIPPIEDRISVFRAAGMPEEMIIKHEKWDKMMDDTSEKRQKELDKLFGKYAVNTKTKTKTKIKTKVIKPVKKKIV